MTTDLKSVVVLTCGDDWDDLLANVVRVDVLEEDGAALVVTGVELGVGGRGRGALEELLEPAKEGVLEREGTVSRVRGDANGGRVGHGADEAREVVASEDQRKDDRRATSRGYRVDM